MTYDSFNDNLLTVPRDSEVARRAARLRALGLGDGPDPMLDQFAGRLARITGAPYAMVNLMSDRQQYFAGLYTPSSPSTGTAFEAAEAAPHVVPHRELPLDHGYCPHVMARRKALVLDDVCDYPRFAGNPVVDTLGIRSYIGAPLVDRTGTALGTICAIATEPRYWGRPGLEMIKSMATELLDLLHRRE